MNPSAHTTLALLLAASAAAFPLPTRLAAQAVAESAPTVGSWAHEAVLERELPEVYDLLIRMERAHGLAYGGLEAEGESVRARGDGLPTFEFEFDMVDRLTGLVSDPGRAEDVAEEAAAGYAVLGARAAEVIAWGNAFYREVLGILADPAMATFRERQAAAATAVARYRSRSNVALPTQPKNMDLLYDHPYALQFRGGYGDLDGLLWAGSWFKLASTEPLTDRTEREARQEGIDTVTNRYFMKLSYGEPPQFFPSEVPLAPAISPGLIALSLEAAVVVDNLSFMHEVLADVLASPDVPDVSAALDEALEHLLDPGYRTTDRDDWELMALRHGIFFQGGYPLHVMSKSERNVGGHAAHFGGAVTIPGMPR